MDDLHICGAESRISEADEESLDNLEDYGIATSQPIVDRYTS
jgi:hypothetical protein